MSDSIQKKQIFFKSLTANGAKNLITTTVLTAEFLEGNPNLELKNLSIAGADIVEVRDISTETVFKYEIEINNIDEPVDGALPRIVEIAIATQPRESEIWPDSKKTAVNLKQYAFTSLSANGVTNFITTDKLYAVIAPAMDTLTGNNFTVDGATVNGVRLMPESEYSDIPIFNALSSTWFLNNVPDNFAFRQDGIPSGRPSISFAGGLADGSTQTFGGEPTPDGVRLLGLQGTYQDAATQTGEETPTDGDNNITPPPTNTTPATPLVPATPNYSVYELAVTLNPDKKDEDKVSVKIAIPDELVVPNELDVPIYVHQKTRTWVQVANNGVINRTLNSGVFTLLPLSRPIIDDSVHLHANADGIVIDDFGDYEVTVTVQYSVSVDSNIEFQLLAGDSTYNFSGYGFQDETHALTNTITRTFMLPNVASGTQFNLEAKSQYNEVAFSCNAQTDTNPNAKAMFMLIRKIETEDIAHAVFNQLSASIDYGEIDKFYIHSNAWFSCEGHVYATWRDDTGHWVTPKVYKWGHNIPRNKHYTLDLGDKIPDGATVQLIIDAIAGATVMAPEQFIYKAGANRTAGYHITGTTYNIGMDYDG
ncbi:MAG: hypothetical protein LBM65_02580 [Oscillospiraceae bacterium]|jgi:hypothetical protein|nr:hypothetical protein [Oscillospiraceae bacterium]